MNIKEAFNKCGVTPKELKQNCTKNVGTKESEFGRIDNNFLIYKGKSYLIKRVTHGVIELDSDKFEGRFGDEFPLNKIK